NPVTIGLAWRAAALSYERWSAARPGRILFLRYEDLIGDTRATLARLETFLDSRFPPIALESYGRNSSFCAAASSKPATGTEVRICSAISGDAAARLGSAPESRGSMTLEGLGEIARVMLASVHLFVDEYLFN